MTFYFDFESFRVYSERRNSENVVSEAVCKVIVKEERYVTTGEGVGPVDALSKALVAALKNNYEDIEAVKLVDYKVRILNTGTNATTRVSIESTDREGKSWFTIGVSPNNIEASFKALIDSLDYKLYKEKAPANN